MHSRQETNKCPGNLCQADKLSAIYENIQQLHTSKVVQPSLATQNTSKYKTWSFLLVHLMTSLITAVIPIEAITSISGIIFIESSNTIRIYFVITENPGTGFSLIQWNPQSDCFHSFIFKIQYPDTSYCTLLSRRSQPSGHPPFGGGAVGVTVGRTVELSLSQMNNSMLPQLRSFHAPESKLE